MILCSTCRLAVPDGEYFVHSKKHQAKDAKPPVKLPEGEDG